MPAPARPKKLWNLFDKGAPPRYRNAEEAKQARQAQNRKDWKDLRKISAYALVCWTMSGGPTQGISAPSNAPESGPQASRGVVSSSRLLTADETRSARSDARDEAHERLAETRRAELDTVLDSMLITQRVMPGTPLEERSGKFPDERIRKIVEKIDDRLGGNIEWPHIHIVDELTIRRPEGGEKRVTGLYRRWNPDGETAPALANMLKTPDKRAGILLDKNLVETELESGQPQNEISIESLLVHELQHATTHDNDGKLKAAAAATREAIDALPPGDRAAGGDSPVADHYHYRPSSESRADMAMILYQDIKKREHLGGPKLNEMPQDERRAAIAGVLMEHLENHHDRERNEAELLGALKHPKYIHQSGNGPDDPHNPIWDSDIDAKPTVDWAYGHDVADPWPRVDNPLDRIAVEWSNLSNMARQWKTGQSHMNFAAWGEIADDATRAFETASRESGNIDAARARTPAASTPPAAGHSQPGAGHLEHENTGPPESTATRHQAKTAHAHAHAGGPDGTAYQRYEIERRDAPDAPTAPDPRETGLRAESTYEQEISTELDAILDSMLTTGRVPPGTPFEERVGVIPSEDIRALMKDIDDNLGGRIEWPNIHISDEMAIDGAMGQYRAYIGAHGATIPESLNRDEPADRKFGITIRRDLYEDRNSETPAHRMSLRAVLVHELQHATTSDNVGRLEQVAEENGWPYETNKHAMAEGRADLAVLLEREIDARRDAGGPKLNEMEPAERREAISHILGGYLGAEPGEPKHTRDAKLLLALRDPAYLASPENLIWKENRDEKTNDYVYGHTEAEHFVPNHRTPEQRQDDLRKPLDQLAAEWRSNDGPAAENHDVAERRATTPADQRHAPTAGGPDTPPGAAGTTTDERPAATAGLTDVRAASTTAASRAAARSQGVERDASPPPAARLAPARPTTHGRGDADPAAAAPRPTAPRSARPNAAPRTTETGAPSHTTEPGRNAAGGRAAAEAPTTNGSRSEGGPDYAAGARTATRTGDKARPAAGGGTTAERRGSRSAPAQNADPAHAEARTEPRRHPRAAAASRPADHGGRAHLKLLLNARRSRTSRDAAGPEKQHRRDTGASTDQFSAPSGRYSTGRDRPSEAAPVRGGSRSVGGSPGPAQREPAAQRAGAR